MTPNESLIALLSAIYLSDCWYFVPHRAVVFRSPLLRAWTWTRTKSWLATRSGGLVLLQALPPLGRSVVCDPWPLAIARGGAASRDTAWSPLGVGEHASLPFQSDAVADLRAEGKSVLAGNTLIARVASNRAACRLADLLRELALVDEVERDARIERALEESFDGARIGDRLDRLVQAGTPLLFACNLLFVHLAAIVPLALWRFGVARAWIALFAGLLALQCWVLFRFVRAHRELSPSAGGERRWLLFQMALSPPIAIRAHDALARDAFAEFHPVAVASVLTPGAAFAALARAELRECRFGARRRNVPPAAVAIRAWFDAHVFEHTAKLVASAGLAPEALLAAPSPEAGARSTCPMCDTPFSVAEGTCEDCGGIPLVATAAPADSETPAKPPRE